MRIADNLRFCIVTLTKSFKKCVPECCPFFFIPKKNGFILGGVSQMLVLQKMSSTKFRGTDFTLQVILKYFILGGLGLAIVNLGFNGTVAVSEWLKSILFNGMAFTIFGMGNNLLSNYIACRFSWTNEPAKTFAISMFTTVIFTSIMWVFVVWLWTSLYVGYPIGITKLGRNLSVSSLTFTLLITIMVSALFHGRTFLMGWRETHLEAEKLRREQMTARFETLKAQVNPHFLFNSLNVLTTLVHKDADLAEEFIQKLSKVYRFTLETREREVISLAEELKQLDSYIFLMKMRFGEGFTFENKLTKEEIEAQQVPPLTLQMLLENSLKHNQASKNSVLKIVLEKEEDVLILTNNLQHKENVLDSSGVGLSNIISRYQILTGKKVSAQRTETHFVVKLPIIFREKK
ncbi:MAG: hypothetical protein RL757_3017 [Bacteroidota bacterium]|jgi:sensor histidine kinase YesM